jgi:glycosyltransferase involved in cell wall biosynthesis
MRIVVVTTSFPRSDDDPSGHFVLSSARALAREGHEVHVIAPGGSPFEAPRQNAEMTLHRAGGASLFAWPGAASRAREAPWRLVAAGPFALGVTRRLAALGAVERAVAHWIVPSAWPLLSGVRCPLEVVAHGADVRFLVGMPSALRARIIGSLLRRGARFTFAARTAQRSLVRALSAELGSALERAARVEAPAIDVPDVAARSVAVRASLGLSRSEKLGVVACRLVASKRVELAIDAVTGTATPTRLVVIGDGPERASLEQRAVAIGALVTFTGALPRREALAWISAADVLVHPSAIEGAPTVIREARALRVRVVACDAGDIAAWAADDPWIIVAEPTPEAIADAMGKAPSR